MSGYDHGTVERVYTPLSPFFLFFSPYFPQALQQLQFKQRWIGKWVESCGIIHWTPGYLWSGSCICVDHILVCMHYSLTDKTLGFQGALLLFVLSGASFLLDPL